VLQCIYGKDNTYLGGGKMLKSEKKELIENMFDGMKEKMLSNLDKYPQKWDGHELRQLALDNSKGLVWQKMTGSRMKEYKNTIMVENL